MPTSAEQGPSPQPISESHAIASETAPAPIPEQLATLPKKLDGRRNNGGKRPNAGIAKGTHLSTKRTYDPEALAELAATRALSGSTIAPTIRSGPVTIDDRMMLARITGESVEIFNERIASKLRDIADLATDRIREHLESDNFKPGELGFILSVAHDKRLSLDGSRALNNAAVNVTVNNFGPTAKSTLLCELDGLSNTKQAVPA